VLRALRPVDQHVLLDVEPRTEDEPQVVERAQPRVGLLGAQAVAPGRRREELERLAPSAQQLVPGELPVCALVLVVVIGRRK
jgi:hypothetical protein